MERAWIRKGELRQSVTLALRTGALIGSAFLFHWMESLDGRNPRTAADRRGSRFHLEIEAVKSHSKSAEEKKRREVLRHDWKDGSRQGNLKRTGISRGEIVNHTSEKHIKKAAAHLAPPVRPPALRQLHLRNRLAAERALPQVRSHVLAAKHASLHVRGLVSKSAHTGRTSLPPRLDSHSCIVKGLDSEK